MNLKDMPEAHRKLYQDLDGISPLQALCTLAAAADMSVGNGDMANSVRAYIQLVCLRAIETHFKEAERSLAEFGEAITMFDTEH